MMEMVCLLAIGVSVVGGMVYTANKGRVGTAICVRREMGAEVGMGEIERGIAKVEEREGRVRKAVMDCVTDMKDAIEGFEQVAWGDMEGTYASACRLQQAAAHLKSMAGEDLGLRDELIVLRQASKILSDE